MIKIIDLGMHPFADTFISNDHLKLSEPVYPLQCFMDSNTGLIKLGCDTVADERYNLYDYSYTSSNSNFSRNHWVEYCENVIDRIGIDNCSKVLEIGSNDGFLSKQFIDKGCNVFGVDSSAAMSNLAKENGVTTYNMIFDLDSSHDLKNNIGSCDLIIANNVFNHANDPVNFAMGVSNLLKDRGCFVFELPYWLNTIVDKRFDQIYHEHVTYFTAKYAHWLLSQCGLVISDIEVVDYHGGSLRVFARKLNDVSYVNISAKELIEREEALGLFNPETYKSFMKELHLRRNNFLKNIYELKANGKSIVCVGAAAKGNTLLNFYNLDHTVIDYVTDSSEHKQGKYTPLTRIPIVGDEIFAEYEEVYALILSWNISDNLKANLTKINKNIKFLSLT